MGLDKKFVHEVVDHSREYVRGQVHTNGLENFWSLLKGTLRGTYVAVEPFDMDQYLSEQFFGTTTGRRKITRSPIRIGSRWPCIRSLAND